mmetsp:Transcript_65537/g.155290  ORF Transcript_65537/g.155290 Transcript_65537/m.155290 type:complete len:245 (+) Transcript_65537:273-1007(+)
MGAELNLDELLQGCLPCFFPPQDPAIFKACEAPDALEEVRKCVKKDPGAVEARRREDRSTPLHLAVMLMDSDLVRYFLANGVDVAAVDDEGRTAVHVAALSGNQQITLMVLDAALAAGLSVDIATKTGYTPLFLACWRGHLELAQALRSRGASENRVDSQGKSMLARAREWNQSKVVAWLEGLRAVALDDPSSAAATQKRALLEGMRGDEGYDGGPALQEATDLQAGNAAGIVLSTGAEGPLLS